MENSIHTTYLKRCFELARKGIGKVSPNPLVGAVIVKENRIISEGWHNAYGEPHAEADAIKKAGSNLSGAVLYCNLEPCCHTKKQTPPCAPLIINSGIKKVILSNVDPNPMVAGKGMEMLKNAGIEVICGVLEREGRELNKFYFKRVIEKKPYVAVKVAQTLDSKITDEANKRKQITSDESMSFVHRLRSEYDAVLVGSNTVIVDNPKLDVRLIEGRNPLRIILDNKLNSPPNAFVFNNDPGNTWLVTSEKVDEAKNKRFEEKGIRVIKMPLNAHGNFVLADLLKYLAFEGVNSLLVEGGSVVFSTFIDSNAFDEIILLQAPTFFGKGVSAFNLNNSVKLEIKSVEKLGSDMKTILVPPKR